MGIGAVDAEASQTYTETELNKQTFKVQVLVGGWPEIEHGVGVCCGIHFSKQSRGASRWQKGTVPFR